MRSVHTAAEAGPVGDSAGGGRLQDAEAKNGPSEGPAPNVANVLPPESTLDYTIPVDVFRRARAAPAGCPESFWSYALYRRRNGADGSDGRVKVHYSRSLHTTERVCREFFLNEPVLGFDLEWMPDVARWEGARRNVCLVQLASPSRIGLFHLSVYPEKRVDTMNVRDKFVAPTLGRILEDENILKLGVSIKGDATRLQNHVGVKMRGLFELSHLHRLVKYVRSGDTHLINRKLVSLATQVEENIGLPLYKGQDVRSSDWSRPLQMDQIVCMSPLACVPPRLVQSNHSDSASDAYAAVQLFAVLERRREGLDPKQPRPALAELDQPIRFTKPAAEALKTDAKPAQPAEKEALPAQIQKLGG